MVSGIGRSYRVDYFVISNFGMQIVYSESGCFGRVVCWSWAMPPVGFELAIVTEQSLLVWPPEEPAEIAWWSCFAGWTSTAQGRAFIAIITGSNRGLGVVATSGLTPHKTIVAIEVGPDVVAWPGQGC